jgi:hypothetical protein
MDEWPEPGTAQPQGWLPPESSRLPLPETAARHSSPDDGLPEYSQPLAYSQLGSYSQPGPYSAPPVHGRQPVYNRPTAYGQPAYGRSSTHPGPGGLPWVPAQPPRRSRLKVLLITVGSLVAALLLLAVLVPVYQHYRLDARPGDHTLTLPKSTGRYVRITTGTASRLGTDLAEQVKTSGGVLWTKPLVGIYGVSSASAPAAVFIGGDGASNPKLRTQLRRSSPSLFIDGFMAGAQVPESTDFPAGKFGGVLRCGALSTTATACVWVDSSTVGTLILTDSSSLAKAAAAALAFRDAAEH